MKFQDISSNLHELCQEYSYLSYLDAESRAAIEKLAVKPEVLQPNETMDVEPWNYFILIAEGLLEVQHDDYCDQQLDMPYIVGLVEFTTRYNGKLSIRALSPVTCYRIDLKRFDEIHGSVHWIQEYIRRFYELEVRRLYKEKADLEDHLQDYFLPENSGMVPGPYGAHHISTLLFVMQDSPDRLRKLLPQVIHAGPAALHAQVGFEPIVGDAGDARGHHRPQIHRQAVGFFVVQRRDHTGSGIHDAPSDSPSSSACRRSRPSGAGGSSGSVASSRTCVSRPDGRSGRTRMSVSRPAYTAVNGVRRWLDHRLLPSCMVSGGGCHERTG